jgi:hypothetical protein
MKCDGAQRTNPAVASGAVARRVMDTLTRVAELQTRHRPGITAGGVPSLSVDAPIRSRHPVYRGRPPSRHRPESLHCCRPARYWKRYAGRFGPRRVPMVLTHREVLRVLRELTGTHFVVGVLLCSAGLRLEECLGLRVQDATMSSRTSSGSSK